jgi:hypothetical protein
MHSDTRLISIWFFIGILLVCYGVLIFAASWYYAANPPANPVVLADLHIGIWWGLMILVIGIFYTWKFRPGKHNG